MSRWEAPAKLNLSLLVSPPRPDGLHPVDSLVQTVEWCDVLQFETVDDADDLVEFDGGDLDPEDNLVARALSAVREIRPVPAQHVRVVKTIPFGAGLGGGSSDAAATLLAAGAMAGIGPAEVSRIAVRLGADVPLFLHGGTLALSGIGEVITPRPPLEATAFAVVVPPFRLDTRDVYREWDRLDGPAGEDLPERALPPPLRGGMPIRNDLLPAAVRLQPMLADFMAEVRAVWGQPVALTGSGSACFGFFPAVDEAADAAAAVAPLCDVSRGVAPRPHGVNEAPGEGADEH